jgi:serine/threonine-protein kinase
MSPEQFMGRGLDGRSDLFSAGVIGYEMLTGERPFTGEAVSTIMHHVIKTDPAAPHDLNVEVPQALSVVLMRALCKRPADRYADGREMAAALRDALSDEAATRFAATAPSRSAADEPTLVSEATAVAAATRPETPAPDSVPPPTQTGPGATAGGQRRQALAAGIAAALMALAGGIATLWALGRPPAPDRSPEAPPNPVAGGPYFEAVTVSVAAYASADDALLGGNPDPRYPDPAVFLTVWDGDGTGLVESVRTTSGERVVLPEDVHPAVIAYEAASAKPGYEPVAAEGRFEALEPGATARVDIRLVPEG